MSRPVDVFIAGGGPAGLAAAIAARKRGFEVVVADGMRPPIDKACGEGLMPDGLAALADLGVSIPAEDSFPFDGIRFVASGAAVGAEFPCGRGRGMRRTALHARLVEEAERCGATLLWATTLRGIEGDVVHAGAESFRARWIVGADGGSSRVRSWMGLDDARRLSHRFAFRRHYRIAPWRRFMEIWWGPKCQIYVTPITADSICVALVSRNSHLRLDDALPFFPELMRRLSGVEALTTERGAVSTTRCLRAVCTGRAALVGDASGSVDAITGEGLCLAFRQALALADALERGDLRAYQAEHRRMSRRPGFMADFMLLLDRLPRAGGRALRVLAANPQIFERMLAMHVGAADIPQFVAAGASLGWHMVRG